MAAPTVTNILEMTHTEVQTSPTLEAASDMNEVNSCFNDWTLETKLNSFLSWCNENSLVLSPQVSVKYEGTSHRYGMIANSNIKKGEILFTIPRTILLHAENSEIKTRIDEYEKWLEDEIDRSLDDSSGWVPLLLTLMYEYNTGQSMWQPYLRLIPTVKEFGHPLFWNKEEQLANLHGLHLLFDVQQDVANMEQEYKEFVVPFIYRNKDICSPELYSLEFYKRMVAFVMAYSFTENHAPCMVPMADILNHHSSNNAHLVYDEDCLQMISTKRILKDEEVFNTFGKLGNSELLQMYGYVEDVTNQFDSVPLPVATFIEVMDHGGKVSSAYVQAMSAYLQKTEVAPSSEYFLFDKNGFRNGPDLLQMLKVLHMTEEEFENVLRKRAGKRENCFYKKLLRKVKLAKKTDTSSGVAVIDITDEETAEMDAGTDKRKSIELEEINDNMINSKRHCNGIGEETLMPVHLAASLRNAILMHSHHNDGVQTAIGNSRSSAILIEDDDIDEERSACPTLTRNCCHEEKMETEQSPECESRNSTQNDACHGELNSKVNECADDGDGQSNSIDHNQDEKCFENNETKNDVTDDSDYLKIASETIKTIEDRIVNDEKNEAMSVTLDDNIWSHVPDEKPSSNEREHSEDVRPRLSNKDVTAEQVLNTSEHEKQDNNPGTDSNQEHLSDLTKISKESLTMDTVEHSTDQSSSFRHEQNSSENTVSDMQFDDVTVTNNDERNPINVKETELDIDNDIADDNVADDNDECSDVGGSADDSDNDDVEFLSEDIGCAISYEKLNALLLPPWKDTLRKVVENLLSATSFGVDLENDVDNCTNSKNERNCHVVRRGQYRILKMILSSLS